MNKVLFIEKQKFTQWWLWLVLLVPLVFILFEILKPIFGELDASDANLSFSLNAPIELWVAVLISILILIFMLMVKMETTIDAKQINVKHLLFVKRTFKWEDIDAAEVITYGFVGYGIRFSLNHGTVYNVKGNQGLLLQFKNGKKRLIGTQRPEELAAVVNAISIEL